MLHHKYNVVVKIQKLRKTQLENLLKRQRLISVHLHIHIHLMGLNKCKKQNKNKLKHRNPKK